MRTNPCGMTKEYKGFRIIYLQKYGIYEIFKNKEYLAAKPTFQMTRDYIDELVGDKAMKNNPYKHEHALRLYEPRHFTRFRRTNNKLGKGIHVIWGISPERKTIMQAIRFDSSKFSPEQAKQWINEHRDITANYIKFSPALNSNPKKRGWDGSEAGTGDFDDYEDLAEWEEPGFGTPIYSKRKKRNPMRKYKIKIPALHKMIKEEQRAPGEYKKLRSIILRLARKQGIDKTMPTTYENIQQAFNEIIQDEKKHANYLGQIQRLLK